MRIGLPISTLLLLARFMPDVLYVASVTDARLAPHSSAEMDCQLTGRRRDPAT